MAIKNWHFGKIILLWAWGIVFTLLLMIQLESSKKENYVLGSILILFVVATPLILSVITWRWLSGREG